MPSTTVYNFGELYLAPFPFTDQSGVKKRPAVIVSSTFYNQLRPDIVLMAVSGHSLGTVFFGEVGITDWQKAGLLKPSSIKPVFATFDKALLIRKLGQLEAVDAAALRKEIGRLLG